MRRLQPRALSKPRKTSKNRRTRHDAHVAGGVATFWDVTIPSRWVKNIIAIFLALPTVVLSEALFTCFRDAATRHAFWATEEFWFFALGAVLWSIAFCGSLWVFGEPRPLRLYVFGHEFTHALWARVFGGKLYSFKVSREGGHVITSKSNFWIALTPYFHPLYSMFVVLAWGTASIFYRLDGWTPVLYGLLGLTWAFHFSFTLWMIPKGQTDLSSQGRFFSLVLIYLMNLLTLVGLLIFAAPEVSMGDFTQHAIDHAANHSAAIVEAFESAVERLR